MKLVETGKESLAERVDAYLDGLLSPAETRATERMLADPEVAGLLAEAIALRELLASGADAPTPPGLADRIIGALALGDAEVERVAAADDAEAKAGAGHAALYGASWMMRGASSSGGGRAADAVRFALGPLALLGAANEGEDEAAAAPKKRAWWSLGLGRRR